MKKITKNLLTRFRRRRIYLWLILYVFLPFYPSIFLPSLHSEDDFLNSPAGQILLEAGLKFIENPYDLFADMKAINEELSPVIPQRHGTIRVNTTFLPFLFPMFWPAITLKTKLISEKHSFPMQIDLIGEYGEISAMRMVNVEDLARPPQFNDYTIGLNLTRAVSKQTRMFLGGKYSSINIGFAPKDPMNFGTSTSSFTISSIDINVSDTYLFTGLEHHSQANPDKYIVAYIGYGLKFNKIVSRISMNYKHLELGMTIFPEGMLVIQPTLAYHWYF
ncbi:MAG: hypothetical protein AB1633_13770 [Elusimicrobiota bacterium]